MKHLKRKKAFVGSMVTFQKKKLASLSLKKKNALVQILRKHGVFQAGIFGSYARGEQKKGSDIDLLVKTKKGMSLFDFAGIKVAAEELLGKKVDLVEYSLLRSRLREQILKEEVRIL